MADNSNHPKSDRRQFLATVGTGFSIGGVAGSADADERAYTTIPTHFRDGEVLKTEKVPTKWYEQNERATRVVHELQDTYGDRPEVGAIGKTTVNEKIGDLKLMKAFVELHDMSMAGSIPSSKDGIKIETTEPQISRTMQLAGPEYVEK